MRIRFFFLLSVVVGLAGLPQIAEAQTTASPGCRARYNRALEAPRNQQVALLRAVISNCPRDRVAGEARARIADLTRASPPPGVAAQRQSRRTPAPPPPPRRADRPPPPPRPPASPARGLTIANNCPYALTLRVIYQTGQNWLDDQWRIGSGNQSDLLDADNRSLRVTSQEIYYIAEGPNGPLFADNSVPYELEGRTQFITPAVVTTNAGGNYQITINCLPDEQASPPPSPGRGRRFISFENDCNERVRIYLSHADGDRNWHPHGPFDFPARQGPTRVDANGITLTQSDNHDLYFYAESLDDSSVWNGSDRVETYNGVRYSMRRAETEIIDNGWLNVRLTCND